MSAIAIVREGTVRRRPACRWVNGFTPFAHLKGYGHRRALERRRPFDQPKAQG